MTLRTEQKLPIILSVVFVTITTFGILFYQSTESLKKARDLDRDSRRFLNQGDRVNEFTLDSANAVRGFMFVGSDTYLDPYICPRGSPAARSDSFRDDGPENG